MHFDKEGMKKKVEDLSKDLEKGELTAISWLWIIGGGLVGFLASCIKWTKDGTKPILAKFTKTTDTEE